MSNVKLDAYLFFKDGKCKEAMEFYKSIFGGVLTMSTYAQGMPADQMPAEMKGHDDKIMHSLLEGDVGLMGSDSTREGKFGQSAISLSLSGDDADKLKGYWEKLVEGGKVTMPLEKAPWGDEFGGLTDKYGVEWMVNIDNKKT